MPGNTASGDQTDYLRMGGFWPSYNVPFYKNIYDVSGNAAAAEKYGPSKSYELAPRAKIFRRDAPNVNRTFPIPAHTTLTVTGYRERGTQRNADAPFAFYS